MTIRQMLLSDVDFAFECTAAEGWQSSAKDNFLSFLEYDSNGCFIAEENGERIGICVAVKYNKNGFIGELIVVQNKRGKGYGKQLFEKAIKYLKNNNIENIYLDGDLDAVPMYEKYNFRKVCKSLRFNGKVEAKKSGLIRRAIEKDMNQVCELDHGLFGDDRSYFLKRRYSLFPQYFHVVEIDNHITGYISAQPGNGLISAGPWALTGNSLSPIKLLESLASEVGDQELIIGILESNSETVDLMRSLDSFKEEVYCWRMVQGESDTLGKSNSLYAIGSGAKG